MLKILQARLQQYMNCEIPDVQAGFRKGRGTRDQIALDHGKSRIQNLRKSSGFDVTDKVYVKIFAEGEDGEEIAASLANFAGYVAAQTLALSVEAAPLAEAGDASEVEWNEGTIRIKVTR